MRSPAWPRRTPRGRSRRSASTPGPSTTDGCATADCSGSRSTTATSGGRRTGPAAVAELIGAQELYRRNGLQYLPFNTVYQLAADSGLGEADQLLLVPDLVAASLAGSHVTERTNASTTGLLDVTTREWDTELMIRLGLDPTLFTDLVDPGDPVGDLLPHVAERVGGVVPVVAVGSHDTASAVVGVPMQPDVHGDAAYVSLGTWALAGLELDAPVLTEEARAASLTNEGGVDGTVRFLCNVMGTWLLSETMRTWGETDLAGMLRAAAAYDVPVPIIDVQDPRLPASGRHGGPHRLLVPRARNRPHRAGGSRRCGASCEASRRPLRPRCSGRATWRGGPSASCTSSAVVPRTPFCARRSPTARACRCWPGRSRRRPSATCWSRLAPPASSAPASRTSGRWSRAPTTWCGSNPVA